MSSGRHNAFSRHSATRPELPFWGSLRLALSSTGLPKLRVKRGLQIEGFLGWSPPNSLKVRVKEAFFYGPFPIQASLAEGWWEDWVTSPSSTPSVPLPLYDLFCFLSVASAEEVHVGAGVGGRGTTATTEEEPPTWVVSRANRSGVFSSNPISSGILVASWLVLTWVGCKWW